MNTQICLTTMGCNRQSSRCANSRFIIILCSTFTFLLNFDCAKISTRTVSLSYFAALLQEGQTSNNLSRWQRLEYYIVSSGSDLDFYPHARCSGRGNSGSNGTSVHPTLTWWTITLQTWQTWQVCREDEPFWFWRLNVKVRIDKKWRKVRLG